MERPRLADLNRLLRYVRPHARRVAQAAGLAVLASGFGLCLPLVTGRLVDAVTGRPTAFGLGGWAAALLGLLAVQAVCALVGNYLLAWVDTTVVATLRNEAFAHLARLPLGFFAGRRRGELVSRLANDLGAAGGATGHHLVALAQATLGLAGALALMFWLSPRLALLALLAGPVLALLAGRFLHGGYRLSTAVQDRLADLSARVAEAVAGIRVIKAFGHEPQTAARFRQTVAAAFQTSMRYNLLVALYTPVAGTVAFLVSVAVLWYGGRLALAGDLPAGDLIAFLLYANLMAASLGAIAGTGLQLAEALGAARRLFELLAVPAEPAAPAAGPDHAVATPRRGEVVFDRVDFRYEPGGPLVLRGLSLRVSPGEVLALVGPSGSGKSTLLNLIPRFYEPSAGCLRLDGRDARDWPLADLRRQLGLVPQDALLFDGSIRDNIRVGRPEASDAAVAAAAAAAAAHEFIVALPGGYDAPVGEDGARLSAGQRQRLALARVFLKDPPVLLLDEATSALDLDSELRVQEALARLTPGRTTIVIGHQRHVLRLATRVAVLVDGAIVEQGTPDELRRADGYFARLVRRLDGAAPA